MHYYKFNIADWALHTSHLNLVEEAVYFRLINFYYDTEKPIPLETESVIRRLRIGSESDAVDQVLSEFFEKTEKGFVHSRCDSLIKEYRKTAKKNKINGAKGGRPRKIDGSSETQEKPTGLDVGTQVEPKHNPNHKPLTNNHKPLSNTSAAPKYEEADMRFAEGALQTIRQRLPNFKEPNLKSWAKDVRLMRERDNREHEEMVRVFTWSQKDSFWQDVIQSMRKFREKYDQLNSKMMKGGYETSQSSNNSAAGRVRDKVKAELEQYEREQSENTQALAHDGQPLRP